MSQVAISIPKIQVTKISDEQGRAKFKIIPANYIVQTEHIAYGHQSFSISFSKDTTIFLFLSHIVYQHQEAVISAQQKKSMKGLYKGDLELSINQLQNIPRFLGGNDPLKILQMTPAVKTAGNGNSGIFVRGGDTGHNLVLFNDAPVYQPSHLLGFFSIFNSGHTSTLQLQKNSIPAQYGGRLSSVLQVSSPDSIPERISVSGEIGIISSQATLALPVNKKYAFYLSARKTYTGLILQPTLSLLNALPDKDQVFDYDFQDYNFSFIGNPTEKDKITVHGYWGKDIFNLQQEEYRLAGKMQWSNLAASASWQRKWNEKQSMRHVLFFGDYENLLKNKQVGLSIELPSSIYTTGYKNEFIFRFPVTTLTAGLEYNYNYLKPQAPLVDINNNTYDELAYQKYKSHSVALFADTRWNITRRISAGIGLRYIYYAQVGPYDDVSYNELKEATGNKHYGRGKSVYGKNLIEPRADIRFMLSEQQSAYITYNRHNQILNLVSISSVGFPTDFWISASKNIPEQSGNNFSAGYYRSFGRNDYELSVEAYYRKMSGLAELNNGLFDLTSEKFILEQTLSYGKGEAYGLEFLLKKNNGKLTGWISYGLGWSYRRFPDINNGKKFPAKHDRRHDLSVTLMYSPNKKWDVSSVFVYATGNAFTLPVGLYAMGGLIIKEYGPYNGYRLPDYHRLDLSATYWLFRKNSHESGFNISIFNVYNHWNPLYLYFRVKESDLENNYLKISRKQMCIYNFVPSLSWIFKF